MSGADRDWINLANALDPERFLVTWAGVHGTNYLRPYLDERVVPRLLDLGLPWFTYLIQENAYQARSFFRWARILADHLLRSISPLRLLRRLMRDEHVDIVISNTSAVTLGAIYSQLYRKPHIWCVKECLDPTVRACRTLARWISRTSSAVVVPSRAVAVTFSEEVRVLPDGSNVGQITRNAEIVSRADALAALGLPPSRLVVAQSGGIVWWKGQHILAEAVSQIAREHRDPLFSVLFLGTGKGPYREQLEEAVAGLSPAWQESVRIQHFDATDYSLLNAADIVVHPSVLPDPFPNAVREAMILGKPVIASRLGGLPEMIDDGINGLLVEPGAADELAAALLRMVSSVECRIRIGHAAKAHALEFFDVTRQLIGYEELIDEVVRQTST